MLILDSVTNVALSVDDVCKLDGSRVSNPDIFRKFAGGLRLDENFLMNDRWAQLAPAKSPSALYGLIMQEMLPISYDANWLEAMGGSLSIRITDVGDYTLVAMNRRVVTLSGLPVDAVTNEQTFDLEIAPEVILSFCRGLLLDVAEDVLAEEDEFEDREISSAELLFNGMPSGGYMDSESWDYGGDYNAARAGSIGAIAVGSTETGAIGWSGDRDWFAVNLNAGVTYRIDLRAWASGRGTLQVPYIYNVIYANGNSIGASNYGFNGTNDARVLLRPTSSGIHYIEVGAYGGYTGTYALQVVNDENTVPLLPAVEVGGDFMSDAYSARMERIGAVPVNGMAQGTINYYGDQDWFAVSLDAGMTYRIDLRGSDFGHGTLRDPFLYGIYDIHGQTYDRNGNLADGGARAANDDAYETHDSMILFTPKVTRLYYISAAAFVSSNGTSYTGTYQLTVSLNALGYSTPNELTTDFGGTIGEAQLGRIGYFAANNAATGRLETGRDQDWFAVDLFAGTTYRIEVMGASSGNGTLYNPGLQGVYRNDGSYVPYSVVDNGGAGYDARWYFTPSTSATYYIAAGSYANMYSGTYTVAATAVSAPTNSMTGYGIPNETPNVDFGITHQQAQAGQVGVIYANSSGSGQISYAGDGDLFAVALNAGDKYVIEMRGAPSGNGTLADPYIYFITNSTGDSVQKSNNDYGGSKDSRVEFTPTETGIYYIAAASSGATTGTYQLYVTGKNYVPAPATKPISSNSGSGSSSSCGSATCASDTTSCGSASATIGYYYGQNAITTCITNTATIKGAVCFNDLVSCGTRNLKLGYAACYADANSCGANTTNIGAVSSFNSFALCGARAVAIGAWACGLDAAMCGANTLELGVGACGTAFSVCGARAGMLAIALCGADMTLCGAKAMVIGVALCGVDTGACGVRASIWPCAGYTVACGVDVSGGFDFGACIVNIAPGVPFC